MPNKTISKRKSQRFTSAMMIQNQKQKETHKEIFLIQVKMNKNKNNKFIANTMKSMSYTLKNDYDHQMDHQGDRDYGTNLHYHKNLLQALRFHQWKKKYKF